MPKEVATVPTAEAEPEHPRPTHLRGLVVRRPTDGVGFVAADVLAESWARE